MELCPARGQMQEGWAQREGWRIRGARAGVREDRRRREDRGMQQLRWRIGCEHGGASGGHARRRRGAGEGLQSRRRRRAKQARSHVSAACASSSAAACPRTLLATLAASNVVLTHDTHTQTSCLTTSHRGRGAASQGSQAAASGQGGPVPVPVEAEQGRRGHTAGHSEASKKRSLTLPSHLPPVGGRRATAMRRQLGAAGRPERLSAPRSLHVPISFSLQSRRRSMAQDSELAPVSRASPLHSPSCRPSLRLLEEDPTAPSHA